MTDLYDFEEDFSVSLVELRQAISDVVTLAVRDTSHAVELEDAITKLTRRHEDLERVHNEGLQSFQDTLAWRLAFNIPKRAIPAEAEGEFNEMLENLIGAVGYVQSRETLAGGLAYIEKYYG